MTVPIVRMASWYGLSKLVSCRLRPPYVSRPVHVLLLVKSMATMRFELSRPAARSAADTSSRLLYWSLIAKNL
jgi:hypothetical protein